MFFGGIILLKEEIVGASHSRPQRFSAKADAIIKQAQIVEGFEKYSFTVNWVIEQYPFVERFKQKRKKEILAQMFEAGLKPGDFL